MYILKKTFLVQSVCVCGHVGVWTGTFLINNYHLHVRGHPFMTSTGGVRLRWTPPDGGERGVNRHVDVHTENCSPQLILSSSHAKKLVFFLDQNFVFGQNKEGKLFVNINQ